MSTKPKITISTKMDVLMAQYPETLPVLFDNKIHCFGCLLAAFHNVGDAAREHNLDEDYLLSEFILAASARLA